MAHRLKGIIPISLLLYGAAALAFVAVVGYAKIQTHRLHSEQAAHETTKAQFAGFKAETARLGEEAKKRAITEQARQEQVSKERSASYEKRLASLNFAYGRLREQSGAGSRPMPPVPNAPVCPDGTASRDQLLAVLRAADEQTLRLLELQEWVKAQQR